MARKIPDNPTLRPKEATLAADISRRNGLNETNQTGEHAPIRRSRIRVGSLLCSFLFLVATAAAVGLVAMQKGYEAGQASPPSAEFSVVPRVDAASSVMPDATAEVTTSSPPILRPIYGEDAKEILLQLLRLRRLAYCTKDASLIASFWNVSYPSVTEKLQKDIRTIESMGSCNGALDPDTLTFSRAERYQPNRIIAHVDGPYSADVQLQGMQRTDGSWGMIEDTSV